MSEEKINILQKRLDEAELTILKASVAYKDYSTDILNDYIDKYFKKEITPTADEVLAPLNRASHE